MTTKPVMDVTPPPGVRAKPYPVWRDQVYRGAMTAFALALLGLAGGLQTLGTVVGGIAVLAMGWAFFVWIPGWRWTVLSLAAGGWGILATGRETWALACWLAGTSIMAAKETHCFHFAAGRYIPAVAVVAALLDVLGAPTGVVRVGIGVLAALWLWLAWDRGRLPLLRLRSEASQPGAPPPPSR
jgi:hypothetical protein